MRPWRTLARRVLLSRPPWMEVAEENIALPDGREIEGFLSIRTRDFVAIVAVSEGDEVVMIRSYKHGARSIALAVPAGYMEDGEDPLTSAKRELREETGYEASEWMSLGRFVVDGNYGVCAEHVFLARGAAKVTDPDSGDLEEMELVLVPVAEAIPRVRRGEIVQLSSAAALALAVAEFDERSR
ncbi:MAG TPA: NUDIX hydrolase [Candidatus Limnocylindria bacterium]|nr:NUDIX hydrolase [Candidatus Limnocylindria bacterium]